MKSTIFRKVLNEEYIAVNKSVPETIKCLRELSQTTEKPFPYDIEHHFKCSKKGKITVEIYTRTSRVRSSENLYPLYKVYGRVISKNDKTYIQISSIYKRYNLFLQYFFMALGILLVPIYILSQLPLDKMNIPLLVVFSIIGINLLLIHGAPIPQQKSLGLTLLPLMENVIKNRVKMIEKCK